MQSSRLMAIADDGKGMGQNRAELAPRATKHKRTVIDMHGNLKPFTRENAAANGRKGGKASGEARRRQHSLRQALIALMSMPRDGEEVDGTMAMARGLFEKACSGDAAAFKLIFDLTDGPLDKLAIRREVAGYEGSPALEFLDYIDQRELPAEYQQRA